MNGFTDAGWDKFQSDLQAYKFDEYRSMRQKYLVLPIPETGLYRLITLLPKESNIPPLRGGNLKRRTIP